LEGLASGRQRGTVALQEQGHGHPLGTVRARARRKGSGWVVSGHKPVVMDGHTADWVIVVALAEEGIRSFLLRNPKAEAVPTLDPTRKLARLVLDEEPVEPLGPLGDQTVLWRRVLDDVSVGLAAELVGVSHRALDEAVEYAKVRVVFDRPIASFQSVKHRIVDMYHSLEMARAGVHFAAWASDTGAPERSRSAEMAGAYAAEAAVRVTGDNIQVHGGVGFTWANDAHFLFKRAKQNEVLMGGTSHQWHSLASALIQPA
jgi:alkylation response protein AidB-like acyl-CoA dehydrogenase